MLENTLFPLTLVSANMHALKATIDDSWLWHQRYGHLHFQGLSLLHKNDMLRGLPSIQGREDCFQGA